jgi:ribosome-associated toxin RatA of RatAB toxin-antitoxin module
MSAITKSITISASADTVLAVLLDVEDYPNWQRDIEKVEVLERDPQSRPKVAVLSIATEGQTATSTMSYEYLERYRFEYFLLESDVMTRSDGSYAIAPAGDGKVEVTVTLGLDVKWPLTQSEIDALVDRAVDTMLDLLKLRAEPA